MNEKQEEKKIHRGLRVLGVPWHTAHQYSLAKLNCFDSYDLLVEPWRHGFATTQRPFPKKMHYVTHIEKGKYDFALLHLDQQSIYRPEKGDRISKGRLFVETRNAIREIEPDLPVVIINHMTPYHDKYSTAYVVKYIRDLVGDDTMVCNSYEAQMQWGFGEVIVHGIDHTEWGYDVKHFNEYGVKIDLPKEPRVIVVLSPRGMDNAYRRIFGTTVFRMLEEYGVIIDWVGMNKKTFDNFDDYRDFLGRSLVFLQPAWQSPRPRSRLEASMSKVCIVSTPYHDACDFIKHGENGFLTSPAPILDPNVIDNPRKTSDLIRDLVFGEPELAIEIGKKGYETALKLFDKQHFDAQWENLLIKLGIL